MVERMGFINRQRTVAGGIPAHTIAAYTDASKTEVARSTNSRTEIAGVTIDGASELGHVAEMLFTGDAKVLTGAPILNNDLFVSDERGRAIPFKGPVGTEAFILGRATHAADEGALCHVMLMLQPIRVTAGTARDLPG